MKTEEVANGTAEKLRHSGACLLLCVPATLKTMTLASVTHLAQLPSPATYQLTRSLEIEYHATMISTMRLRSPTHLIFVHCFAKLALVWFALSCSNVSAQSIETIQPRWLDQAATQSAPDSLEGVDAATSDSDFIELPSLSTLDKNKIREVEFGSRFTPAEQKTVFGSALPYTEYRSNESFLSYLPGDGQHFGWIDFESTPYLQTGQTAGITTAINVHWMSGPLTQPLPARLYDFVLGYQWKRSLTDRFSFDLAANVGIYSDFEDSARDGVRTLAHAVGMRKMNDNLDFVFGVDYLCRDDIKMLPVFGCSWHNPENPAWRFDLVFPRPRIDYTIAPTQRMYLSGLMGGGTWDIEMPNDVNDVMTYKDLRVLFGYERLFKDGSVSAIECGPVFDRKLTFRTIDDPTRFDSAFIIRFVTRR